MMQFIITILIFALGFVGMALALHFSKWKKREESCCGGGHCGVDHHHEGESCESKKEMIDQYFENEIKTKPVASK